jgi:IclR family KDG regulon transcriptional repressor
MEKENQYIILSVKKALRVLKLFDSAHKSMTLTEISQRADMRKGTMVRVLATLEDEGFVRYDEMSKRYSLGMSVYVLSNNAFRFVSIADMARPYLEKVTKELNLIAHLSVLEGDRIMLIDRVVPNTNANSVVCDLNSEIGGEVEAHNTGAGKVLTAFAADKIREKIIRRCSFKAYSEQTVTNENEYRQLLETVKKDGYAVNNGESEPYLKCITYPIFGYENKIEAALSLSGLIQYFDEELEKKCHNALEGICDKLSAAFGKSEN